MVKKIESDVKEVDSIEIDTSTKLPPEIDGELLRKTSSSRVDVDSYAMLIGKLEDLGVKKNNLPKNTFSSIADYLLTIVEDSKEAARQANQIEERKTLVQSWIMSNLPKTDNNAIGGKRALVMLVTKEVPVVTDWNVLYEYIVKMYKKTPEVFSLLQRRLAITNLSGYCQSQQAQIESSGAGKKSSKKFPGVPGIGTIVQNSLKVKPINK